MLLFLFYLTIKLISLSFGLFGWTEQAVGRRHQLSDILETKQLID